MAYVRKKNPQGTRQTSLRTQFRNALRNAERRTISDVAFSSAVSNLAVANVGKIGLYKNLKYDEVYAGISRKVGNKTVYYKGEEAVRIQIQSLNRFASKTVQNASFIQNYISAMRDVGFAWEDIQLVRAAMESVPIDFLTYLIKRGPREGGLPAITDLGYYYKDKQGNLVSTEEERKELILQILQALTYDKSAKERIKDIRARARQLRPILEQQIRLQGHLYTQNTL